MENDEVGLVLQQAFRDAARMARSRLPPPSFTHSSPLQRSVDAFLRKNTPAPTTRAVSETQKKRKRRKRSLRFSFARSAKKRASNVLHCTLPRPLIRRNSATSSRTTRAVPGTHRDRPSSPSVGSEFREEMNDLIAHKQASSGGRDTIAATPHVLAERKVIGRDSATPSLTEGAPLNKQRPRPLIRRNSATSSRTTRAVPGTRRDRPSSPSVGSEFREEMNDPIAHKQASSGGRDTIAATPHVLAERKAIGRDSATPSLTGGAPLNKQRKQKRKKRSRGSCAKKTKKIVPPAIAEAPVTIAEGRSPKEKEYKCSICLDSSNYRKMKPLQCCHVFHQKCIDAWFEENKRCPICRHPTFLDDHSISCFSPYTPPLPDDHTTPRCRRYTAPNLEDHSSFSNHMPIYLSREFDDGTYRYELIDDPFYT